MKKLNLFLIFIFIIIFVLIFFLILNTKLYKDKTLSEDIDELREINNQKHENEQDNEFEDYYSKVEKTYNKMPDPISRINFDYLTDFERPTFPEPTDIFILTPEFGEWADIYSQNNYSWINNNLPEIISSTRATGILYFGGTVMGTGDTYMSPRFFNQKMIDDLNIKAIAWLGTICVDPNPDGVGYEGLKERLLGTSCIDIEGRKIPSVVIADEKHPYAKNLNHPVWREFLIEITKRTIDLGITNIGIDEISDSVGAITNLNGCFDEFTINAFREYLKNKYTLEELEIKGVFNIDTFDYGKFIRENYLEKYYSDKYKFEVPLFIDFIDFQVEKTQDFWKEFTDEIRDYGKTKNKKITFGGNTANFYPVMTAMHSALDYFSAEIDIGYPSQFRTIPFYKFAISLKKPLFSHPQSSSKVTSEILSRTDVIDFLKIYTAEAYSSQGQIVFPERYDFWWEGETRELSFTSKERDEIGKYYKFIRANPQYYENILSTARVGLFYSYPSHKFNFDRYKDSFYGIQNILLESQIQYDIIFAGDDYWIDDKLNFDILKNYDVIILADTIVISNKQDEILISYLNNGGRIFAFGDIGNKNESGEFKKTMINNLIEPGFKEYNNGWISYIEENVGKEYIRNRSKEAKQKFQKIINQMIKPNIIIEEKNNIGVNEYWNQKDKILVIHIINYDYDIYNKKINLLIDTKIKVSIVEEFRDKNLKILYNSPDYSNKERLEYEIIDDEIIFNVPEHKFYGVVSIKILTDDTY